MADLENIQEDAVDIVKHVKEPLQKRLEAGKLFIGGGVGGDGPVKSSEL